MNSDSPSAKCPRVCPIHIDYKVSSPSAEIPGLLDQLGYSLISFGNDAPDIMGKMFNADPDCFIAQVLASVFNLSGNFSSGSEDLRKCEALAERLGGRKKLTEWETQWLDVVSLLARLQPRKAVHLMMDMLSENPYDVLAMFIAYFLCLFILDKFLMRDIVGRVMPAYPEGHPYRGIMDAFYGFAMLETFNLAKAEKLIGDAMMKEPDNAWTIHANAHLLEYINKYPDGLVYLEKNEESCEASGLKCHLFWHKALFQLGLGDKDGAYDVFQKVIKSSVVPGGSFIDATSLLWRLKFQGYPVSSQEFQDVLSAVGEHVFDHSGSFSAFHTNACYLGAEDKGGLQQYQKSLDDFLSNHPDTEIVRKFETVGKPLMKSMQCFTQGDYSTAADLAYEVRDGFLDLGGSEAQKDFMHYMLFHSLKNCNFPEPQLRLKSLLAERSGYRELAPPVQQFL